MDDLTNALNVLSHTLDKAQPDLGGYRRVRHVDVLLGRLCELLQRRGDEESFLAIETDRRAVLAISGKARD